jgi:hypothetical protein
MSAKHYQAQQDARKKSKTFRKWHKADRAAHPGSRPETK